MFANNKKCPHNSLCLWGQISWLWNYDHLLTPITVAFELISYFFISI